MDVNSTFSNGNGGRSVCQATYRIWNKEVENESIQTKKGFVWFEASIKSLNKKIYAFPCHIGFDKCLCDHGLYGKPSTCYS